MPDVVNLKQFLDNNFSRVAESWKIASHVMIPTPAGYNPYTNVVETTDL